MRQAGRYQKFYRKIRRTVPFIDLCKNPELAAEVTVRACEQTGADAAILFSDILLILEPLGFTVKYSAGEGPVVSGRIRIASDVDRIRALDRCDSMSYVFDAVRLARKVLSPEIALIGFCGAPFTIASYILEGGKSGSFARTKMFMRADAGGWDALMNKICPVLTDNLRRQIDAGADAVQIFDSWAGCLSPVEYRKFVLPYTRAVVRALKPRVPMIHFGTGTGPFLKDFASVGAGVISVDHRVRLDAAWKTIGYGKAIQGNLDPKILLSSPAVIRRHAKRILDQAGGRAGHIFNLGHGVLPDTPEENVSALIDFVHELSA